MSLQALTTLAQWAGIAMPTLYAGITFQYSLTMSLLARTCSVTTTTTPSLSPSASPTPNNTTPTSPNPNTKLLARQWLALYQLGPVWVPPLIHTGILSNLYLSFLHPQQRTLYLIAALLTFSILPFTFLYLEPGINGACKWKVAGILKDEEGFEMAEGRKKGLRRPSVVRHSASEGSKRWAEGEEMGVLVEAWAGRNHARWVVGVGAGVVSFLAMERGG